MLQVRCSFGLLRHWFCWQSVSLQQDHIFLYRLIRLRTEHLSVLLWSLYGTVREISSITDIMYGLSYSEVKVVIFFLAVLMSVRVTALFPSVTSLFSVALFVCEIRNM
jgi:hypothetical protein